jgi:hypothetical protein
LLRVKRFACRDDDKKHCKESFHAFPANLHFDEL